MSDFKKDSDDAKKKSGKRAKTKKIKEPSLEEQLLSVGLKLDPIEKSSKLQDKCNKRAMQNRKLGCNGKVLPSKKELEQMFKDNSDGEEVEVATEPTPVIDVNAIVEKAVGAMFNNGVQEEDFFGTDALNYNDKVESVPRNKLPCVFRYLNPREEPPPERTAKKCSVGKGAKNLRRGPGEPCMCEKGIDCKKRKHKCTKMSQDEETRPPKQLKLKFLRDSDGYKIINGDTDSSQIVLKEEAMMPLAESSPKRRSFSPLPSTSHDNATFEMNDRNYYQSLGVSIDDSFSETAILSTNEVVVSKTEPVDIDEPATEGAAADEPRQTVDELLEIIDVDDSNDDQDCVVVDVDAILAENRSVLDGIRRKRERAAPKISSEIVTVDDSQNDDVIHVDEGPSALRSFGRLLQGGLSEIRSMLRGSESSAQAEPRARRRRAGVEVVATVDLTAPPPTEAPFLPSPDSQTILDMLSWCDPFLELLPSTPPPPPHSPLDYPLQMPVYQPPPVAYPPQPPAYSPPPAPSHRSGPGECPICLEALASPMSTLCGHVFCRECLTNIMKNDKRCPTCRKAIKKNGFHPIYF